jgi:hypothetical protein
MHPAWAALAACAILLPACTSPEGPTPTGVPRLAHATDCWFCPGDPPANLLLVFDGGDALAFRYRLEARDGGGVGGSAPTGQLDALAAYLARPGRLGLQGHARNATALVVEASWLGHLGAGDMERLEDLLAGALAAAPRPQDVCCCECAPDELQVLGEPGNGTYTLASIDVGPGWSELKQGVGAIEAWVRGDQEGPALGGSATG